MRNDIKLDKTAWLLDLPSALIVVLFMVGIGLYVVASTGMILLLLELIEYLEAWWSFSRSRSREIDGATMMA